MEGGGAACAYAVNTNRAKAENEERKVIVGVEREVEWRFAHAADKTNSNCIRPQR